MLITNSDIEAMIHHKSKIDVKLQEEIIKDVLEVFVKYGKDMLFIDKGFIGTIENKEAFKTILFQYLSEKYPKVTFREYNEEKDSYKWFLKVSDIYNTISVKNRYELLAYENDPFREKQTIIKDEVTKTITVITNKIHVREVEAPSVNKSVYNEIIGDYKEHFKFFDDFLKLIIDMRFAKDRKASFLHLRVKSNWGKSFLSGLLKEHLQIGIEVDYHNLINKNTNDIYPVQVRNSIVMLLDEFNSFSAEMKKISHNFRFAPKYGMTEEIPLYLKVLLSAEKSKSFTGGVDDQIVNRVMVMDIPDNEVIELDRREVYKKYGNALYMAVIAHYSYLKVVGYINEYLSIGNKYEAHRKADNAVKAMFNKLKMTNTTNLKEDIKNIIEEGIYTILNTHAVELPNRLKDHKNNIIVLTNSKKYKDKIFIKNLKRVSEDILLQYASKDEYKKMQYKIPDIEDILNTEKVNKGKVTHMGTTHHGIIVNLDFIKEDSTHKKEPLTDEERISKHMEAYENSSNKDLIDSYNHYFLLVNDNNQSEKVREVSKVPLEALKRLIDIRGISVQAQPHLFN